MKKIATITSCIFFIALVFVQTAKETGTPSIINYTPKDYACGPQNWAIIQNAKCILYVVNSYGLLEFEGTQRKMYQVTEYISIPLHSRR